MKGECDGNGPRDLPQLAKSPALVRHERLLRNRPRVTWAYGPSPLQESSAARPAGKADVVKIVGGLHAAEFPGRR